MGPVNSHTYCTYHLLYVQGTAKQLFHMCCFELASKLTDVLSFQLQVYLSVLCVCVVLTLLRTYFRSCHCSYAVPFCCTVSIHRQVMQNIGNLTPEVDAKELFMRPMITFIQESIGRAKQYILDLIQIDQKLGESFCDEHPIQHPHS